MNTHTLCLKKGLGIWKSAVGPEKSTEQAEDV